MWNEICDALITQAVTELQGVQETCPPTSPRTPRDPAAGDHARVHGTSTAAGRPAHAAEPWPSSPPRQSSAAMAEKRVRQRSMSAPRPQRSGKATGLARRV